MVISKSKKKDGKEVVSLYIPKLVEHLPRADESYPSTIKKEVVTKLGGQKNASCRFLRLDSTDRVINSSNSAVRRSVLQIPRHSLEKDVISSLDRGNATCM